MLSKSSCCVLVDVVRCLEMLTLVMLMHMLFSITQSLFSTAIRAKRLLEDIKKSAHYLHMPGCTTLALPLVPIWAIPDPLPA